MIFLFLNATRHGHLFDKINKTGSRPISRVLSWTVIHLASVSPRGSSNLPGSSAGRTCSSSIWSCSEWGLPCHYCYQQRGALLPHHFNLTCTPGSKTRGHRRYVFCCTFRRLTPPRCYLALCPVEPGLSSVSLQSKDTATV